MNPNLAINQREKIKIGCISPKLALYWKFIRLDIVIFCDQPEVTTDIKWINFTLHKFKQYINSVYTHKCPPFGSVSVHLD